MAYVIAVVGAGGKTTLCYKLANDYASRHNKVCVLTTTHMWNDRTLYDINTLDNIKTGFVYDFGTVENDKRAKVSDEEYRLICEKFDYVIIEADGSKCMPLKIPNYEYEPSIPQNVNEIIICAGSVALGRKIEAVCYRLNDYIDTLDFFKINNIKRDTVVTDEIIDKLIEEFYLKKLIKKFPKVKFAVYKSDMSNSLNYQSYKKIAFGLCAAGNSTRFGDDNKLLTVLAKYDKPLYKVMVDNLLTARYKILDKLNKKHSYDLLDINIVISTKYDEIIDFYKRNDNEHITTLFNENADEGLSSSIKLITKSAYDNDAIAFFNADMPNLTSDEIANFIYSYMCSNNDLGSMFTNAAKNPAIFDKKYYDDIMEIAGDNGPKDLLNKYKSKCFRYHVLDDELYDIDTKEDIDKCK